METLLRAWYVGTVAWTALPVGCLALLIVNHLMGREVFLPRVLEAGCRMLWPAALCLLPVLAWPDPVFPWATAGFEPTGPFQAAWLGQAGFALRTALCFAVWIVAAEILIREDRVLHQGGKRRGVAAVAGFAWLVTAWLAAVDWLMALDPHYASAGFGLTVAAHQVAAALGFAVLADSLLARDPASEGTARALLAGATLIWGFFTYMEFLVVWSGNVPALTGWFVERAPEGWPSLRAVAAGLTALGVGVALAVPATAGTGPLARGLVRLSAGLILLAQGIEALWLTLPVSVAGGWTGAALSVLALGAVAVPFLAVFLAVLAKRRPLPRPAEPLPP